MHVFGKQATFFIILGLQIFLQQSHSQPLVYPGISLPGHFTLEDSTAKAKVVAKYDSVNGSTIVQHPLEISPLTFNIGFTYNYFTQKGIFGEFIFNNVYAIQGQYLEYTKFNGIMDADEYFPKEKYEFTGIHFGAYTKNGRAKLGAFAGVGMMHGVEQGELLRTENPSCDICIFSYPTKYYYEEINLDGPALSLKFQLGLFSKYCGTSLSEQIFFVHDEVLVNTSLNFEFGKMK